jgi:hypothetical protein
MFNWNDLRCKGRQTYPGLEKAEVKCGLSLREVQVNSNLKKTRTTCVARAFVVKFLTLKLLKSVSFF